MNRYGDVHLIDIERFESTTTGPPVPPSLWLSAEEDELPPLRAQRGPMAYEILEGHEIWKAAQLANTYRVPAFIDDTPGGPVLKPSRSPYLRDPITEAHALDILKETHHLTDSALAERLGWSRKQVADYRRLLRLDPTVQELVRAGRLGVAKAAELVSIPIHQQRRLADQALKLDWNLKDIRSMARKWKWTRKEQAGEPQKATASTGQSATAEDLFADYSEDPDIARLERELEDNVGCKVRLQQAEGVLLLKYGNFDVLEGIIDRLMSNAGRAGDRY